MKNFFKDGDKLSMGRLLCFCLFVIITIVFIYVAVNGQLKNSDIPNNIKDLIIWGWIVSIGGKGAQTAAEALKLKLK